MARLRPDSRVITSRKAIIRAMSASTGVAGALAVMSSACPAGLKPRSAPGLGVGAGVITGKSPAAFPAPTKVRLAAPPAPMSELVPLFGFGGGPSGGTPPELVELAVGAGLEDAEGVGLEDAEGVGLAVGVGEVGGSEFALGVGVADVETVGLGVDVGGGDVEGPGLALVLGAGVDGDGLGVSEALGSAFVLAAAGEAEGEESTALANAGLCELADSPATRKPPVTRPATTARRCALDMWTPHSTTYCTYCPVTEGPREHVELAAWFPPSGNVTAHFRQTCTTKAVCQHPIESLDPARWQGPG